MNKKIYKQELINWNLNAKFHEKVSNSPSRLLYECRILNKYNLKDYGNRIVDIGCGVGGFIREAKKMNKEIYGVDFSIEMLKVAKSVVPSTKYIQASAESLPFRNDYFDVVIANALFHHLKAQSLLCPSAKEIHRILKKNGILYIFDEGDSLITRILKIIFIVMQRTLMLFKKGFPSCGSFYEESFTAVDLNKILKCGFQIENKTFLWTAPVRILEVFSNGLLYLFGWRSSFTFQKMILAFVVWLENNFNFKFLCTTQCLKIKKL